MRRALAWLLGGVLLAGAAAADSPLRLAARIPLPGVEGRIDHLALDAEGQRLFVAALGSDSVEAVDLARRRRVARIEGLREPQGVLFLPRRGELYVTLGGAAAVAVVSGSDLAIERRIATREDPDNIRYEAGADRIWVGAGSGKEAVLAVFGSGERAVLFEIALDDHPESFQLEAKGARVFANVPGEREVEVIDREQRRVTARWKLPCAGNFPMALDEEHGRLFVGCRRPARILGLDTETGRVVAEAEGPADADDLFLDPAAGRLIVSAGAGLVRSYLWRDGNRLEAAGDVATAGGARTSLFDPASRRLFVAAPARRGAAAEILVFETSE